VIFQTDGARPRARFLPALALVAALAACSGTAATPSEELNCIQADADNVVQLTAENIAFSAECIEVAAGEPITIEFENSDGSPHDIAIYTDSTKATEEFKGDVVDAGQAATYDVPALGAGDHFFLCTIHPNMTGTIRAVEAPTAS
jgi:plastocyanin